MCTILYSQIHVHDLCSMKRIVQDIAHASSLKGSVSNDDILSQINRYFYHDLLVDLPPFLLRQAISYSCIDKDSDCLIPNDSKFKRVSSIKAKISSLIFKIKDYTNRNIYCAVDNVFSINNTFYSTEREKDFLKNGRIQKISEGSVSRFKAFVLNRDSLRHMSNYFTRVSVYSNKIKVASFIFNKIIHSKTLYSDSCSCMINFQDRVLTVQYFGEYKSFLNVIVESFSSNNSIFISKDVLFGVRNNSSYHEESIFLDSYVYPVLTSSINDKLDPTLEHLKNIIIYGVARNLATIYQNSPLSQALSEQYTSIVSKYAESQTEQDTLHYINDTTVSDPLYYNNISRFI